MEPATTSPDQPPPHPPSGEGLPPPDEPDVEPDDQTGADTGEEYVPL